MWVFFLKGTRPKAGKYIYFFPLESMVLFVWKIPPIRSPFLNNFGEVKWPTGNPIKEGGCFFKETKTHLNVFPPEKKTYWCLGSVGRGGFEPPLVESTG